MANKIYQDIEQIRKTIEIFNRDNGLFEIRSFKDDKPAYSGYFKDIDNLIKKIENQKEPWYKEVWYFVLNEINDGCYSRTQRENIMKPVSKATSDIDIIVRNWLFIDCDPKRPSGISATNEEKAHAYKTVGKIYKWLQSQGFSEPLTCDSGNGYHLLYKIRMDNNKENTELIENFLKVIDIYFGDEHVGIDRAVKTAARVTKLYGTLAQKGSDDDEERPHRMSKILYVPENINLTSKNDIKRIADMLPKPEPKVYNANYNSKQFDLREFMSQHGIRVKHESPYSDGTRFVLEECIFDPSHTGKDAALFQFASGAFHYHCFHDSCSNYKWQDVRLKFEPDAYDDKSKTNGYKHIYEQNTPNYKKQEYKPHDFNEISKNIPKVEGTDEPQPIFYTTEQIRAMPRKEKVFIKTGIDLLDRKIRGLEKGKVTMLLGESGSGKSSLISQFNIEAANQDFRTGYFSGELECEDVYEWLVFQAAGRQHIRPTQWENFFVTNSDAEILISQWLDDKIFIYNNKYGNKFEFLKDNLGRIVKEKKLDFVILDNLMSIDIGDLAFEANAQQTEFVTQLKQFAAINDVHILFVAHQRKINESRLAGKYDNCGSSNLVNYVDNQFIIYRVSNNDNHVKFRMKENHTPLDYFLGVGNELRISKNRKGGLDLYIPLYFENESKRLKNYPDETKIYGWNKRVTPYNGDNKGMTEVTSEDDLPGM